MDRRQLRTVLSKDFGVNKLQSVFFYGIDVGSFKHETNARFSSPNTNHYSIYVSTFFLYIVNAAEKPQTLNEAT